MGETACKLAPFPPEIAARVTRFCMLIGFTAAEWNGTHNQQLINANQRGGASFQLARGAERELYILTLIGNREVRQGGKSLQVGRTDITWVYRPCRPRQIQSRRPLQSSQRLETCQNKLMVLWKTRFLLKQWRRAWTHIIIISTKKNMFEGCHLQIFQRELIDKTIIWLRLTIKKLILLQPLQ